MIPVLLLLQLAQPAAWGWGAAVHRMLTQLALDGLPPDAPAWLRDADMRQRIAFASNQPDRWRGWRSNVLKHENDPEHYLDTEQLAQFGLSLETIPKLRYEYLRTMAVAKQVHPENVGPYDPAKDPARINEWPGFVLHAVAEHYARLQAAFNQVRILERLNEPARRPQLEQARALACEHLGNLSHFIADIAQPLHTTEHYNGWVGDNPAGYHWRDKFHAYIDEGFADAHHLDGAALKAVIKYDGKVNADDPWDDVLAYLRRSHTLVPRLYELERDGQLDQEPGLALIRGQLADATTTLSALVWAAYTSAAPTDQQVEAWARYDDSEPAQAKSQPLPATQPAGEK